MGDSSNVWAAIGAAAVNGMFANAGTHKSYKFSNKLMQNQAKLNYDYSLQSAENMPSSIRAGLENANYNPMLAVQNSTSGSNSSFASPQSSPNLDYSGAISSGIANAQSFQRLKNETNVANKTSKKLEAEGENLSADTAIKLEESKFIAEKRKKEIANIQADTLHKEAQIDNMTKRIELDRYINDSGLATTRRGQDIQYNASTYGSKLKNPFRAGLYKIYKSDNRANDKNFRNGRYVGKDPFSL